MPEHTHLSAGPRALASTTHHGKLRSAALGRKLSFRQGTRGMTTPTCLPRAREEGVLANCCLISQLGRRERSEQGLQCRLVWADERVCLRREQHCFEELVVRLLYGRQVGAENRRGAHGTERVDRGAKPCRVDLVHRLSTDAHSSCRSRTWPPTARTSADVANSSDGIGAPKQSELNSTPVRASRDPVVEGLPNSGGLKACRWRSPNSRAWPGLSRKTRSRGTAHSRDMIPGPRKVVTRRAVGAASKSGHRPPVWSRSGWVIQSHRTSAGVSTSARTETKSLSAVLRPVSMTTGCSACRTKALTGRNPSPGTSAWSLRTVTSPIGWMCIALPPCIDQMGWRGFWWPRRMVSGQPRPGGLR